MLKEKKKLLRILMVLLMLVLVLTGCSNESEEEEDDDDNETQGAVYAECLENYFKGIEKGDLNKYKKAFPDFFKNQMNIGTIDMEEMVEGLERQYGSNVTVDYEVIKENSVEKDDLDIVEEYIYEKYNVKVEISDGKDLKIKITIKGKKDTDIETNNIYVYKVDGEWKLLTGITPDIAKPYIKNH